MTKVSVAIVFYNSEEHILKAIYSVLSQSFRDLELLLIDDGSDDGSLALVKKICDPRIRIYSEGGRRHLSRRLNEAVKVARGQYFVRMDADDIMFRYRIERQLSQLENGSEDLVLGSSAVVINEKDEILGVRRASAGSGQFIHPTVAAKTDWFKRNPYAEDDLFARGQDAELWLRTRASANFRNLSEPLLFYRERSELNLELYLRAMLALEVAGLRHIHGRVSRLKFFGNVQIRRIIVSICALCGRDQWLLRRRYVKLKSGRSREYNSELLEILKCAR